MAWMKAKNTLIASIVTACVICIPFTLWFFNFSTRRGRDILTERHERGAANGDMGISKIHGV
ncbi:hypothetical protein [Altericroceibacterium spongiae]|uniref:hypothetical protein n=1 Tax=Altericroceibacterium spongiae TaxID=2320269 RepID=UPI0011C48D5F|nr:hypothetical protein [Altericroceibacterium spongiae]